MRLALTIVCPGSVTANIVLEADPAAPIVEIAADTPSSRCGGADRSVPTMPPYVDGQRLPPKLTLVGVTTQGRGGCQPRRSRRCVPPAPRASSDASLTRSAADGAGPGFNRPPRLLLPQRATRLTPRAPPAPAGAPPAAHPYGRPSAGHGRGHGLLPAPGLPARHGWPFPLAVDRERAEQSAGTGRSRRPRARASTREHKARIKRDAATRSKQSDLPGCEQCPLPRCGAVHRGRSPQPPVGAPPHQTRTTCCCGSGTADLPSSVKLIRPRKRTSTGARSSRACGMSR